MAFLTIEPAAGLSPSELQRAIEHGPPEVGIDAAHEQMLADVGFAEIAAIDMTVEFSRTQQAWIDSWHAHQRELERLLGPDVFNERMAERRAMRHALDEGLLRRTLYIVRTSDTRPVGADPRS
jgi:hypothetical protein